MSDKPKTERQTQVENLRAQVSALIKTQARIENQRDIYQSDALRKAQHITRIDNKFKAFTRMNFVRMAATMDKDELLAELLEWQKQIREVLSTGDSV